MKEQIIKIIDKRIEELKAIEKVTLSDLETIRIIELRNLKDKINNL